MYKNPKRDLVLPTLHTLLYGNCKFAVICTYIVHEHKNVIALDKVDCKLSCRETTDEIDEKCHTGQSDKGDKRAPYFAL